MAHQHPLKTQPRPRWKCDKCDVIFPEGTRAHFCKKCDYDLCGNCIHVHPLELTMREHWTCDACGKEYRKVTARTCLPCDFDLCQACYIDFPSPSEAICKQRAAVQQAAGSALRSTSSSVPPDMALDTNYCDERFKKAVDEAITNVNAILTNTRIFKRAGEVHHLYDDKYGLANLSANASISSLLLSLESLGVDEEKMLQFFEWSRNKSVTLDFDVHTKCAFVREEKREVESGKEYASEYESTRTTGFSIISKKIVTITEYFYKFNLKYTLRAYQGTQEDEAVVFNTRSQEIEIMTRSETLPYPKSQVLNHKVNITHLLSLLQKEGNSLIPSFKIDRDNEKDTRTPRRNAHIESLFAQYASIDGWCRNVRQYLMQVKAIEEKRRDKPNINLSPLLSIQTYIPFVTLFEDGASSLVLSHDDIGALLAEQKKDLVELAEGLSNLYPAERTLLSVSEARICVILAHMQLQMQSLCDSINSIEQMLYEQLHGAIGKSVGVADFYEYMQYHNRKLFKKEYQSKPFSQSVRRVGHNPEGVISIETGHSSKEMGQPIASSRTLVNADSPTAMKFTLNAATDVTFHGPTYVHTWVDHQFGGERAYNVTLRARARQFSSFILMVGRIVADNKFLPKAALIIKNKSDLELPLLLETIPTPKEFRDAIESLSPEQQRFAKAYRAMQLESTLFGVVALHIKPQLERLLNLPVDALAKHIRLSEDLLEMFMKYQIPSDLLSYDGDCGASTATKVARVKENYDKVMEMVSEAVAKNMSDLEARNQMNLLSNQLQEQAYTIEPAGYAIEECCDAGEMDFNSGGGGVGMFGSIAGMLGLGPKLYKQEEMIEDSMPFTPVANKSEAKPPKKDQVKKSDTRKQETVKNQQQVEEVDHEQVSLTALPKILEKKYSELDSDSALRPTIINLGETWSIKKYATLLSPAVITSLDTEQQESERNAAFDLIDALSRSGGLPFEHSELHVVIAATHCFQKTLVDTVVQNSINPIEKVERSLLIMSSTAHSVSVQEMLSANQVDRVRLYSPQLFE